jgi:hypothetical protein
MVAFHRLGEEIIPIHPPAIFMGGHHQKWLVVYDC